MRRVAITGIGIVSPVGIGRDAFWSSLIAGQSGIDQISLFDASGFPVRIAAEVKGFDDGPVRGASPSPNDQRPEGTAGAGGSEPGYWRCLPDE